MFFKLASLLSATLLAATLQAQTTLTGLVTDPTGAVIPGAHLILHSKTAPDITATAGEAGAYTLTAPPGAYTLDVSAAGFAPYLNPTLTLPRRAPLNIALIIATQSEQVEVSSDSASPTDPAHNGDALTLKGAAIDQLPTDQTQLNQQLTALTGGNTPDIYVDGFSGGTIPPKESIREIKINQNPYSAQNDTNPVNGRLEILTKPGSDKFHGHLGGFADESALASKNPFAPNQPPYYFLFLDTSLSGPINKTSSFFAQANRRTYQGNNIVSAQILGPANQPTVFNQAIPAPTADTNFTLRYDLAAGKSSTLTARYSFDRNAVTNAGVGGLTLQSQGYANTTTVQTLQLSNSQILSPRIVDDTRFQYVRSRIDQIPNSTAPALVVEGAFNGGGSNAGSFNDNLDRYELQNYVAAAEGKHFLNFGGRLRVNRDANSSRANYNGQYTFTTLAAYQQTLQGVPGAAPSQFTLTTGNPTAIVTQADLGLFLQDDWKLTPSLTLSPGFRFETQSGIHDHADYAPRLGLAYNLFAHKARPGNYTLRAGVGYFYDRIGYSYLLQAQRQNGISQQQFVDNTPTYPETNPVTQQLPSLYQLSPNLHAATYLNTTLGLDRRIGTHGTVSVAYTTNHGTHTLVTRNANAPLPTTGLRPYGTQQDIYQYDSGGVSRNQTLLFNSNLNFGPVFLYGFYRFRSDFSDGQNANLAAHPYNLGQDYGPTSYVRDTLSIGAGGPLSHGFRLYANINARSATPFNITLGQDLNGDSIFNDRPTYATDLTRPSVIHTAYGNLDSSPIAGQTTIPYNLGRAPAFYNLYTNLQREFAFGPEIKPPAGTPAPKPGAKIPKPDRRYNLSLQLSVINLLNHPNYAVPVSVLTASDFGRPTALAFNNNSGVREIELGTFFHF